MMAAIVVPCGRLNIAITLACLESARVRRGVGFPTLSWAGWCLDGLASVRRPSRGLLGRFRRFVLDLDGLKALLGDPKRAWAVLVAAPDRQGAARRDFLDETFGQELGNDFASGSAGQIGWPLKGTVVALRCRRQQHQLGITQFHGILHSVDDGERRHHRSPAVAIKPAGQDSEMLIAARNGHSTAPFAPECQSFLDNLRAGFGANRSANDPQPTVTLAGKICSAAANIIFVELLPLLVARVESGLLSRRFIEKESYSTRRLNIGHRALRSLILGLGCRFGGKLLLGQARELDQARWAGPLPLAAWVIIARNMARMAGICSMRSPSLTRRVR